MIKINLLDASSEKKDQLDGKTTLPILEKLQDLIEDLKEKYNIGGDEGGGVGEIKPVTIVLKVLLALLGVILLNLHELDNLPILRRNIAGQEEKLKGLNDFNGKAANVVAEIKKMKKNKEDIEKQIASVEVLSKVRLRYVKAIDIIQQNIQEKMWLTSMKSSGDVLMIEGIAHSDNEISTFIEILNKNIQFSAVDLLAASESQTGDATGKKFRNFSIKCTLEKIK